jgi:hypothetical protein
MEELELHLTNPSEGLLDNCEMYAKMALLMLYPLQQLTELTCLGSYWKMFHQELTSHDNKKTQNYGRKDNKYFKIYRTG